ncbi:MAG: hypothetical protein RJB66_1685 [Pseudomonadota bacterium]|jgi:glycosyltransferase involved in cell wall biosynthesis
MFLLNPLANKKVPISPQPLVSVIVRTQYRPLLLERALISIANQTYKNFEVILVNDGGPKEALNSIIPQFTSKIPKLKVFNHAKSIGRKKASNFGISVAEGELIVIHDDDDTWLPAIIEKAVTFLIDPKNFFYGGVTCHADVINEVISETGIQKINQGPYYRAHNPVNLGRELALNNIPNLTFFFKRAVLAEVGLFNEDFAVIGDWEFNVRVLLKYDIGCIQEVLAFYHHRIDSEQNQNSNTITRQMNLHRFYDTSVRNDWLRKYLNENPTALGPILNQSFANLQLKWRLDRIERKIDQLIIFQEKIEKLLRFFGWPILLIYRSFKKKA